MMGLWATDVLEQLSRDGAVGHLCSVHFSLIIQECCNGGGSFCRRARYRLLGTTTRSNSCKNPL